MLHQVYQMKTETFNIDSESKKYWLKKIINKLIKESDNPKFDISLSGNRVKNIKLDFKTDE